MRFAPVHHNYMALWMATLLSGAIALSLATAFVLHRPKPILITVGEDQTIIVEEVPNRLREMERRNFIRTFIHIYTNYDHETLEESLGRAMDWVSEEVWEAKKAEIAKQVEDFQKWKPIQVSETKSIRHLGENRYEAVIHTSFLRRSKRFKKVGHVTFEIRSSARTKPNPWGFEIIRLDESWSDV